MGSHQISLMLTLLWLASKTSLWLSSSSDHMEKDSVKQRPYFNSCSPWSMYVSYAASSMARAARFAGSRRSLAFLTWETVKWLSPQSSFPKPVVSQPPSASGQQMSAGISPVLCEAASEFHRQSWETSRKTSLSLAIRALECNWKCGSAELLTSLGARLQREENQILPWG